MSQIETLNHSHAVGEKGWLFHSEDCQTTEEEYLYLLYAFIFCLKPLVVLETGTFRGAGSVFMARALRRNGHGKLIGVEKISQAAVITRASLDADDLGDYAEIITSDSLEYLEHTKRTFDFAFFDSHLPIRCKELEICLRRKLLKPGCLFAIHDTSRLRVLVAGETDPETVEFWKELEAMPGIKFVEFPLSRGLVLGQVL